MSFYQQEGSAVFKVRQWLGGIKFWIVCGIIRALGYPALAKKVWGGWQVRPDLAPLVALSRACFGSVAPLSGHVLAPHDHIHLPHCAVQLAPEREVMAGVATEPDIHALIKFFAFCM